MSDLRYKKNNIKHNSKSASSLASSLVSSLYDESNSIFSSSSSSSSTIIIYNNGKPGPHGPPGNKGPTGTIGPTGQAGQKWIAIQAVSFYKDSNNQTILANTDSIINFNVRGNGFNVNTIVNDGQGSYSLLPYTQAGCFLINYAIYYSIDDITGITGNFIIKVVFNDRAPLKEIIIDSSSISNIGNISQVFLTGAGAFRIELTNNLNLPVNITQGSTLSIFQLK
jgi:hypothetical protein